MVYKGKVELSRISCDKVKKSQGGFRWKKKDLKARLTIARLLGKKVPLYSCDLLQPTFSSYLSACLLYLQRARATTMKTIRAN